MPIIAVLVVAAALAGGALGAQTSIEPCLVAEIEEDDNDDITSLGLDIAFEGDLAAVGAAYVIEPPGPNNPFGEKEGIVLIYEWDGEQWNLEQMLASTGEHGDYNTFGQSVALRGDLLAVGAKSEHVDSLVAAGSVSLYRRDAKSGKWVLEDKVFSQNPEQSGQFGSAVALDKAGERLIAGARMEDVGEHAFVGRAYIFEEKGDGQWEHQATLIPPEPQDQQAFASKFVALNDDLALVGAGSTDGPTGATNGAAFLYRDTGDQWELEHTFTPPDAGDFTQTFGINGAWSPDGNLIAFGAPKDSPIIGEPDFVDIGSIYFFRQTGDGAWEFEGKVYDPNPPGPWAWLGATFMGMTDDGKTVLGDAWQDWENGGFTAGAAHLIRYDEKEGEWFHDGKILDPDGEPGDFFGANRISGNRALILGGGKISMYHGIDGLDCTGNGVANACDIHSGEFEDTTGTGIPDVCEQAGDLNGDGAVNGEDLGLLLSQWGECLDPDACPADLTGDGEVNGADLGMLLSNWTS